MSWRNVSVLVCVLAACTSAGEQPGAVAFAGTIAGAPFRPADATGFLMEPSSCAQLGAGTHTIAKVLFSTRTGACQLAQESAFCGEKAETVTAYVAIARADLDGDVVAPIGPGTYSSADHGNVDGNGVVHHFWAGVDRNGTDCAPLSGGPKEGGDGTIVFDEVGPARIRGSAVITFDDGSALAGSFDAPVCPASDAEFCDSLKGGCVATCVP